MKLVSTELNQRLANVVNATLASQQFYISGKSNFWRFVGAGIVILGLGSGIGLALSAYSSVTGNSKTLDALSAAISKALGETRLRATASGTVKLDPAEIGLAPNQTISLEQGSMVALDRGARVIADGELRIQIPSYSSPAVVPAQQGPTRGSTITNFTVFKSVNFDKGQVQTGWTFLASTQREPTNQYCYYQESLGSQGEDFTLDIGRNGLPVRPKTLPSGFDLDAAFNNCIWFKVSQ